MQRCGSAVTRQKTEQKQQQNQEQQRQQNQEQDSNSRKEASRQSRGVEFKRSGAATEAAKAQTAEARASKNLDFEGTPNPPRGLCVQMGYSVNARCYEKIGKKGTPKKFLKKFP